MSKFYETELLAIARTYADVKGHLPADLDRLRQLSRVGSATYVGSGGMLGVANLAASLHNANGSHLAIAATPLQAIAGPAIRSDATVLLSARAKHPDVLALARTARDHGCRRLELVTHRSEEQLNPSLVALLDHIYTIPSGYPDGFLATNSVIAFSVALIHGFGYDTPRELPGISREISRPDGWEADRWLVTYSPMGRPAAEDLEARLSETGLRQPQLADLRNLAHGRHVGLHRRSSQTLLVLLTGPDADDLAKRTLNQVPEQFNRLSLTTDLPFPAGSLDLMALEMRLVGLRAHDDLYDVGAPKVGEWGRRLYHLGWYQSAHKLVNMPPETSRQAGHSDNFAIAVDHKLQATDAPISHPSAEVVRTWLERSLQAWLTKQQDREFSAAVLDYDGTCCTTRDRFQPPASNVQHAIISLLDANIKIGFASGRGKSLVHGDTGLRAWIPREYWNKVTVGLYNGALIQPLTQDIENQEECIGDLHSAHDQLLESLNSIGCIFTKRKHQITVELPHDSALSAVNLLQVVRSCLQAKGLGHLKLAASGHSIDIVRPETSKCQVLAVAAEELAATRQAGHTLAVGDSGQVGGNDFELLAATSSSLSVNRCSPDPSRCWNVGRGETGPTALAMYLAALRVTRTGLARLDVTGLIGRQTEQGRA